ncbi:MAG TPA: histidine kinase [Puia sp.]|jgi:hypothetical protein
MTIQDFIFSDKPGYRITHHVVFWVLYGVFFYMQSISPPLIEGLLYPVTYKNALISVCCFLPVCIFSVYISIYILFPFFLEKKKYIGFVLAFIFLYAINIITDYFFSVLFINKIHLLPNRISYFGLIEWDLKNPHRAPFPLGFANAQHAIILSGFALGIKSAKNWYLQWKENNILERQKNRTALQLLKARIHPEFLFHSLDSLYQKINVHSPDSPEMILNLSEQLSYSLYESDTELVSLERELIILKKCIAYQKLKSRHEQKINLEINGIPGDKLIPPLVLLPLVQHVFELTCDKQVEQPEIDIKIDLEKSLLKCILIIRFDSLDIIDPVHWAIVLQPVINRLDATVPENYHSKLLREENVQIIHLCVALSNKTTMNKSISVTQTILTIHDPA